MQGTQSLGRYLGVPIIHGRNSKHLYQCVLERIENKLAGWKVQSLSFAGRVSLAISALNTIPAYLMQTTLLPNEVCNDIDKRIRDFIWGSFNGERKMHLISWEKLCQPKSCGGLGIRSAKEMNLSFLMKLTWGLLQNPEALWVKVLKTKYLKQSPNGLIPKKSGRRSSCWKGINESWQIFTGGLSWSIRNGRRTNFWRERWLDNGIVIGDLLPPPSDQEDKVIAEFCDDSGAWDVNRLAALLPLNILRSVIGMTPPCSTLDDDTPVWGLEPNGTYSVKSGYLLAKGLAGSGSNGIWKAVWSWKGPQRVRQFLWTATHNRLMTNAERHRRHLTGNPECGLCVDEPESQNHILRSCPMARQVWASTLNIDESDDFFSLNVEDWWRRNITSKDTALIFGLTCWILWNARNIRVFEGKLTSAAGIMEQGRFWARISNSAQQEVTNLKRSQGSAGVTRNIYWKAAQGTSYTLNTDGSVRLSDHVAAAGGCLRDNDGRVIDCFAANLGDCSITRAELTGVINGLDRAWNIGIREVEVQTDSACVVKLLTETMPGNHQHATLIQKFKNISQRAWSVSVKFVYREANHLADFLANKGHELTLGTHTIETSESNVLYWAKYDLVGGSETRTIFI
ncbi:Putative ribonuclease H protein At1g65750 [Linum perenne]